MLKYKIFYQLYEIIIKIFIIYKTEIILCANDKELT